MQEHKGQLGFWSVWALAVGTMIGSGILLLPTRLAPFGMLSYGGWILGAAGTAALVLVFGQLAKRTTLDGGPYIYVRDAFGDFAGFLMAWGYWLSFWGGIPVVAITFVGYLGFFIPLVAQNAVAQELSALALIAALTFVNIRGLKEMSAAQIAMTVLKIVPLVVIIGAAIAFGSPRNLPPFNPSNTPVLPQLAAVTLITLWPFTGFEAAVTSAGSVRDPARTIPRALIAAILIVAAIYLSASFAVNLLVPPAQLEQSQAPFADAARVLGPWGAPLIAIGALIATAGTLNGLIFTSGQMPMAVAEDGKAPKWLAKLNKGGAPYWSLLLSSTLGAGLLLLNYSRGLIGAYTFLLMMATALSLIYYFFCGLAELKHSWRAA
ncbi:MAG: amino acid permease, partial [Proteobacteria bacterium]|nr:amino acid permease [Pseudomonadota bacterium]